MSRLATAVLSIACLAAGCASSPDPVQPDVARILAGEPIAEGIVLFRGRFPEGRQPDGNSVLLRGPEGWVVFDTGRHEDHARRLLAFARASDAPVAAIVNSHWHLDHSSGNRLLRDAYPDAPVHASAAVVGALPGFLADYRARAEAMLASGTLAPGQREDVLGDIATITDAGALLPTETVSRAVSGTLAGRKLDMGLAGHAATAADVWLYDPATRVLLAGDLVTLPAPFLDTACPTGWQAALDALDDTGFALLVPGHGEPMDRAGFNAWRDAFDGLLACAATDAPVEACADGWIRGLGPQLPSSTHARTRDLVDYYVGLLRDESHAARYCPR